MDLYQVGDILKLRIGDGVHTDIPEMFVFKNKLWSKDLTHIFMKIGEELTNLSLSREDDEFERIFTEIQENVKREFSRHGIKVDDGDIYEFVRTQITPPKKETFYLPPGFYRVVRTISEPDNNYEGYWYHVFCVFEGDENLRVDFYQTGEFIGLIKEDRLYARPRGDIK